jgi:hypothetical protein
MEVGGEGQGLSPSLVPQTRDGLQVTSHTGGLIRVLRSGGSQATSDRVVARG